MPLKRLSENPFWVCTECESILRDYPISIEVIAEEIMDEPPLYEFCWSRVECDTCRERQYIQTDLRNGESLLISDNAPMLNDVKEVEDNEL